ncbi:hypothetical protein FA15DRAFT_662508 [Coprinopsis marcescibilis]|uniref:Zn(2)-C6 fungal-type domain-containing protein n=1 Tax=Coprinopsis marcescibilis TaxID=230819 RepID=A0A5C3LF46_COPMA|nr:hypothetical protein FA15DRAFT_662508 [Coprinopsis marcescibilis]
MPRASSVTTKSSLSSDPLAMPPQHPNVLKRNQACHQCRRRKLKCDAKRPCSTCVRSHAHALSHAPPGANLPPKPECTFDEVAEHNQIVSEGPKNKYERLENRINELESMLRQKDHALLNSKLAVDHATTTSLGLTSPGTFEDILLPVSGSRPYTLSLTDSDTNPASVLSITTGSSPTGLDLIWPNWPTRLPPPDLMRHLVEVFFVFHPHAPRLFHVPTFMNSLALPPTHPKFPATPVLHAICAIGSLYTAAVTSPPLPNFDEVPPDEIFLERLRAKEQRPDSFAEQHAKLARETAEQMNTLGENLFQVLQANIILTWFYWSHGRWVDIFLGSAHAMRLTVPLGLNMCPPFHSITKSERAPSILAPARTVIEDEMRRNAFWLAYTTERQHGCGNGWALSLDDQDISQLLPVRGDQFENGTLVPPLDRQWAHTRDLLVLHPESQTDSFIMYIKGTILISRIKSFNMRFRARHFAGDAAVACGLADNIQSADPVDPRGSAAFIELDHTISAFKASFPSHLRNSIVDNVVDNHLYTAFMMPHVATIVLHDPHADVRQSGCISALKILTAARSILDLIYSISSTSFDITLLDSFCPFCWFASGRVLVRFLQVALDARQPDQITTLKAEIDFIHTSIAKVGQRIPLAHRFAKMLDDLLKKRCGPLSSVPLNLSFPRSTDASATIRTLFEEGCETDTDMLNLHQTLHDSGSYLGLKVSIP